MMISQPSSNPFTPSFGTLPPDLLGRGDILRLLREAMATGPQHPGFSSLILGKRGTGKTALLLKLRAEMEDNGWVVCKVDALPSQSAQPTSDAIAHNAYRLASELAQRRFIRRGRVTSNVNVNLGIVAASFKREPARQDGSPDRSSFVAARPTEHALAALWATARKKKKAGVLLLVDEFHNLEYGDAARIASAVQNGKTDHAPVAFVGAGLDFMRHTLLCSQGFTFFQRCYQHHTAELSVSDTKQALWRPLKNYGINISSEDLTRAALSAGGHPYAIQSLGSHIWKRSMETRRVCSSDLNAAIADMSEDVSTHVVGPLWNSLSARKRDFLSAMSMDARSSRMADMAPRINATRGSASQLRHELIADGLIRASGHGEIAFINDAIRDIAVENRLALSREQLAIGDPDQPPPKRRASEPGRSAIGEDHPALF